MELLATFGAAAKARPFKPHLALAHLHVAGAIRLQSRDVPV